MKLGGSMHLVLLLLALLNMVPTLEAEDSWGIFSIAVVAAVASWFFSKPGRGTAGEDSEMAARVPAGAILVAVFASIIYLFYEMFGQHDEPTVYIIDLGHFMVFLCCCKFFELRTNRDAGLILLISFLLLIIGGFVSASLLFGIAVSIDITIGVMWLLAFQAENESQAVAARRALIVTAAPGLAGAKPKHPDGPAPGRGSAVRRGFILSSLACTLGILAVAITCFVVIPRGFGRGFFGRMHRIVPTAVSGFSEEIELRDTAIFEDPTPVMRVQFMQDNEILGGEGFVPYMRAGTMDRYLNNRWVATNRVMQGQGLLGRGLSVMELPNREEVYSSPSIVEQHVELKSSPKGAVFAIYPPVYFGSGDLRFIQQDPVDLGLRTAQIDREFSYVVYSLRGENTSAMRRLEAPPRESKRDDTASMITPKVREYAQGLIKDLRDKDQDRNRERVCRAIEEHLGRGDFEYTLSRGKPPYGVDAVEDFLLSSKRGHCQYFASAMGILCQAVGIPARLANGYAGGEYDRQSGYYLFRQKDAHTWVEAYLPNKGWTVFDPTPPASERPSPSMQGAWARAQQMLDMFRFKWSSAVVSFDADRRFDILGRLNRWYAALFEGNDQSGNFGSIIKTLLWGPEVLLPWERGLYWLLLTLCLIFGILFIRLVWILSMTLRAYFPSTEAAQNIRRNEARFYDRILVLLAHKGFAKHGANTPMEFARALARTHQDLAELPLFTGWFYDAQYGGRGLDRNQSRRIRGFVQRLREDPAYGTR